MDPSPPGRSEKLGRYRLLEALGAGGMAVVYRAVIDGPQGFSRNLVIKRIRPELALEPAFINMLVTEARLCSHLHHPAIVQVNELCEENGEYFLVMEYVEGFNLLQIMKALRRLGREFPTGLACYLISEVAGALDYAHTLADAGGRALEIIHRDVSPSNIMITPLGGVKLLDFGIAKAATHLRGEHSRTGSLKGKIGYMAPEQAEGLRNVDRRLDVFALGTVFHECLTGQRLFQGDDEFQTLRLVRQAQIPRPSTLRPDLPPEIDGVVLNMMARQPENRFTSCREVAAALSPIVHRLAADAAELARFVAELPLRPSKLLVEAPTIPDAPGSRPTNTIANSLGEVGPRTAAFEPGRRPRAWMWTGLASGVVVAAATALVWLREPPRPRAAAVVAPPSPRVTALAPSPAAVPAPPSIVHLQVSGTAGAHVSIDGQPRGRVPLELDLPRQSMARTIKVERSGYLARSQEIAGNSDSLLVLPLRRSEGPEHLLKNPFSRPKK